MKDRWEERDREREKSSRSTSWCRRAVLFLFFEFFSCCWPAQEEPVDWEPYKSAQYSLESNARGAVSLIAVKRGRCTAGVVYWLPWPSSGRATRKPTSGESGDGLTCSPPSQNELNSGREHSAVFSCFVTHRLASDSFRLVIGSIVLLLYFFRLTTIGVCVHECV